MAHDTTVRVRSLMIALACLVASAVSVVWFDTRDSNESAATISALKTTPAQPAKSAPLTPRAQLAQQAPFIPLIIEAATTTGTSTTLNATTTGAITRTMLSATSTTMLFVGDMFFDRHIRVAAEKRGGDFLFSCIDPLFQSVDIVVGNLEGPITTQASVSLGTKSDNPRHFQFTFPTTTAALLARHNVRLVNLGNNHIANFGKSGITATRSYLEKAGVAYFGGIANNAPLYRVTYNERPFSFISYNQFGGDSAQTVAMIIAQEKSLDRTVIVYTHWGDEYAYTVASMEKAAKLFAENGADIVIGSHPHVVLDQAYLGDTLIYYSLGNFIFDQYFNARVKNGLAVALTFSSGTSTPLVTAIKEYPVTLKTDGRTCLVDQK